MDDGVLRDVCNRFLDAVEDHDLESLAALYAPGFTIWANLTGERQSKDESLQTLIDGRALHRRRTYDDRSINTFHGGFLVRYSVNVVQHDGRTRSFWACLVAECRDGQITHIDEYLDSSKFGGRKPEAAT